MPRRIVLLIALLALALIATAAAPWTLSGGSVAATVARHLREGYGLDLQVRGRSTIAVLPVPRVKFEDASLVSADGAVTAEGGTIRGELRLLPLLIGRVELSEVGLSGSKVRLSGDWARWSAGLAAPRASATVRRLIVTGTTVRGSGFPALDDVNVVVNWPGGDERLDLAGSLVWSGERIDVKEASVVPASLVGGQPGAFALTVSAPSGSAAVTGEAQIGADPRLTGTGTLDIRSLRDFARWSGIDLPLGSVLPPIGIKGDFSANRRRLSWPSAVVTIGADRLDGTLGLRFDGDRPGVNGTLAAESLDLSDLFAPFLHSRNAAGWSSEEVSLRGATGSDLDLRVSATDAKIGRLKLTDMAASVLVRPDRIEASLGRAAVGGGALKGRLALIKEGESLDLRAQGSFERVELGPLLPEIGRSRWIAGQASGQFNLEGSGSSVAEMVRDASGRASITVRQGELVGIGLNDVLRRIEKRPLAASLEWKGGRTPFDTAQMHLAIGGGVAEVSEASLTAPTLRTSLQGRMSLVERSMALQAHVDPAMPGSLPSPLIVFHLTGGWDDIAIRPDARALIERSGAAKPLFGDRVAPRIPAAPMATAQ